jgi:hypothetical protein
MDFPPTISTIAVKPADLTARLFWHGSNLLRLIGTDYCQGLGLEAQIQFALTALLSPTVLTDLPTRPPHTVSILCCRLPYGASRRSASPSFPLSAFGDSSRDLIKPWDRRQAKLSRDPVGPTINYRRFSFSPARLLSFSKKRLTGQTNEEAR